MLVSATSARSTSKVKSLPTQLLLLANKQPANLVMSKLKRSLNNLLEKIKALKLLKLVQMKSQSLLSQSARAEVVKAKKHSKPKQQLLSKKKDQRLSDAKMEVQLQSQLLSHLHIS